MKRFLPIIPVLLLMLLNACGASAAQASADMQALFDQTMTATMWTPLPTQTYNPNIPNMVSWLNTDLSTANPLEQTLDAEYRVVNVSFPNLSDSPTLVFRVDVRCECMNGADCCMPERTFVVIMGSMKRNSNTIVAQVPGGVSEMLVVCFDLEQHARVGAMSALWQDVRDYLLGILTGYQLGVRVVRTVVP